MISQPWNIVGGDYHHSTFNSILKIKFQSFFILIIGTMVIAPYGFLSLSAKLYFMLILFNGALENSTLRNSFQILKHYNLTYFSHKIFFNVKINKN
jgi:hypothetical protein